MKGEEQTLSRSLIRFELENILAIHQHLALDDMIIGMTGEHFGERAFTGAVRPHDGVDFAARNGKAEPAHDLFPVDLDV